MQKDQILRPLNQTLYELQISKSSPWQRIGGSLLDGVIEIILAVIFVSIFLTGNLSVQSAQKLIVVNQVISLFLNLVIPMFTRGQTLGKMAAGTRIISVNGNVGNVVLFLVRGAFFSVLSLIGSIEGMQLFISLVTLIIIIICVIQLFADDNTRTLQDRFARTIVVDDSTWQYYRGKKFHKIDHPERYELEKEQQDKHYYDENEETEDSNSEEEQKKEYDPLDDFNNTEGMN